MTYEDEVAIGTILNSAIASGLNEYGVVKDSPTGEFDAIVGTVAQAVLVQLDQAGYQITRK